MSRARETAEVAEEIDLKVDYSTPVNEQTGTSYTFQLADARKLTTASSASAVTLTIPPQSSVQWEDNTMLRVVNYGVGAVTVAGGSGVTVTNTATTLAQFESAAAIRTGSDAWTLVPFGGAGSVLAPTSVEYSVIAGGGGGGNGASSRAGGGGGAGGLLEGSQSITQGTSYTITVGGGGSAGAAGSNSVFASNTATSGGSGADSLSEAGGNGGSGGGGSPNSGAGGTGTAGQGNNGGAGRIGANTGGAGGGGGANAAGTSASVSTGGNAGNGKTPINYASAVAGGGGGGGEADGNTGGTGGTGGGGRGAGVSGAALAGAANTGGGGGGGTGTGSLTAGKSGGSGLVVIRQTRSDSDLLAITTGSPTITIDATYITYAFGASGTIQWGA